MVIGPGRPSHGHGAGRDSSPVPPVTTGWHGVRRNLAEEGLIEVRPKFKLFGVTVTIAAAGGCRRCPRLTESSSHPEASRLALGLVPLTHPSRLGGRGPAAGPCVGDQDSDRLGHITRFACMDRHLLDSRYASVRDKDYSRGYKDDRNGATLSRDVRINPYDSIRSSDVGLRRSVNSGQLSFSAVSDYRAYPPADKRAELSRSDLARDRYAAPALR